MKKKNSKSKKILDNYLQQFQYINNFLTMESNQFLNSIFNY